MQQKRTTSETDADNAAVKEAQSALFGDVLYTVGQAAKILTILPKTVYCLVWSGRLKGVKVGHCLRFRYRDLEEYAKRNGGKK